MGLDESSIQRLILMPFDDKFEDLTGENDVFFFSLWVGVQNRFNVYLCAYVVQEEESTNTFGIS